jgi:hypothetical protein
MKYTDSEARNWVGAMIGITRRPWGDIIQIRAPDARNATGCRSHNMCQPTTAERQLAAQRLWVSQGMAWLGAEVMKLRVIKPAAGLRRLAK